MSRNLLIVAFAALSLACATGASANEYGPQSSPIAREASSAPIALELGRGGEIVQPGAPRADNGENHVVKAGVWSSIKSAAKKVGSGVAKAGKAVAKGVGKVARPVGKAIWNNGPVKGVRDAIKAVKVLVLKKKA